MAFERVDYHQERLTRENLTELPDKLGMGPRELIRNRERAYRELELDDPDLSAEE